MIQNLYSLDAIGFSQDVITVYENEGVVNVTIFSYCNVTGNISFTIHNGNATESK